MTRTDHLGALREFEALRALSAEVGANPLLVQAAGGNTSIKIDGVLWIKASGTWLARAVDDDIMVPVALEPLLAAIDAGDPDAEKAARFVIEARNPSGLRPSIETTVHAVMPQRVVVHVHCVETIATAVRLDAPTILAERLAGMAWVHIPYVKPGLDLARQIMACRRPETEVLILGNHGLAVAAETVDDAAVLLRRVGALLAAEPRRAPAADPGALVRLAAGSVYRLPDDDGIHATATDLVSCRIAAGGSLYPDHVVFLGPGSVIARPGETAAEARSTALREGRPDPAAILFPGKGVLMQRAASASAAALARCLAEVAARVPQDASLRYLTAEENAALLDWDAEKYRQSLNRTAQAGRA